MQIFESKRLSGTRSVGKAGIEFIRPKVLNFLFFRPLPLDIVDALIDCSSVELYPASKTIYTADEVANHVYVLLSGQCMVFKGGHSQPKKEPQSMRERDGDTEQQTTGEKEFASTEVRYVQPGQTFGEAKFLSLEVLQPPSVVNLAEFVRTFQTRPIKAPVLDGFGSFPL